MENEQPDQTTSQEPKQSHIADEAAKRRKPAFDPTGRVESLTANEVMVADVRRHFIGLLLIYLQVIVALGLSFVLIFTLLPDAIKTLGLNPAAANAITSLFGLFAVVFGILFLVLATRIYNGNQLIVSDKNVTQVLQIGLFDRKISELSMENVEDVTAQQRGIFPTLFNYGTLTIETAGEQNNFIFVYCPNPNAYAKAILDARIEFITKD